MAAGGWQGIGRESAGHPPATCRRLASTLFSKNFHPFQTFLAAKGEWKRLRGWGSWGCGGAQRLAWGGHPFWDGGGLRWGGGCRRFGAQPPARGCPPFHFVYLSQSLSGFPCFRMELSSWNPGAQRIKSSRVNQQAVTTFEFMFSWVQSMKRVSQISGLGSSTWMRLTPPDSKCRANGGDFSQRLTAAH